METQPVPFCSDPEKTLEGSKSDTRPGQLQVRCPSCHEQLAIPADASLSELTCSSCGSHFSLVDQHDDTWLAPSLLTMGRFELVERLGVGGFGTVWKARDRLFLMSLVENLARRQHCAVDLLNEINVLREREYSFADIAKKTDLNVTYVRGIVKLLRKGEERLLHAVEQGQIPLSVAITIACSDDHEVQRALAEAYETNSLRGKKLLAARRLIETRRAAGKPFRGHVQLHGTVAVSGQNLLKTYEEETTRQRIVIQKAKLCETRLLFVVSALRQLFGDERLVELLRGEELDTLPAYLAEQIYGDGRTG